jgi:hypothetical protein
MKCLILGCATPSGASWHARDAHTRWRSNRSHTMWFLADVIGPFSINVGPFSRNVVPSAPIFSANVGPKNGCYRALRFMLSGRYTYRPRLERQQSGLKRSGQRSKGCEYQRGSRPRLDGTVNTSELLVNVVKCKQPKVLTGCSQKAS